MLPSGAGFGITHSCQVITIATYMGQKLNNEPVLDFPQQGPHNSTQLPKPLFVLGSPVLVNYFCLEIRLTPVGGDPPLLGLYPVLEVTPLTWSSPDKGCLQPDLESFPLLLPLSHLLEWALKCRLPSQSGSGRINICLKSIDVVLAGSHRSTYNLLDILVSLWG